ncbi:hypothetical protein [Abyssibacter profundi]|nr:hypothetical protein [Abyssibacter profundi]
MKAQLSLLVSALMASSTALAASGTSGTSAETEMDPGHGPDSRAAASTANRGQFRYDGGQQAARASMRGRLSVSKDQVVSAPDKSFAKLDRDGDGMISAGESTSSRPVLTQFDRADQNGDRMLSATEFDALVASFEEEMAE